MFIQLSYTDPKTHAVYPNAVLAIENVRLQLEPPAAELELALYVDADAGKSGPAAAFTRWTEPMTPREIGALRNQFAAGVFGLLLQRPAFSTGQIVTG